MPKYICLDVTKPNVIALNGKMNTLYNVNQFIKLPSPSSVKSEFHIPVMYNSRRASSNLSNYFGDTNIS